MFRSTQTGDGASSRRHFLAAAGFSLSPLALMWLEQQARGESAASQKPVKPALAPVQYDLTPKTPPAEPRAKAMISLWMQGGPSHIDLFDPKPVLNELDGKPFPGEVKYDNAAQASSKVLGCPWKFAKHGECGAEFSELAPHLASVADDLTVVRSTRTGVNNHGQSIRALMSGRILPGRPTLGSWITYALGAETENLPAYVALNDPGQLPVLGVENWSQGFLPSIYQGTVVRPTEPRILNLNPPADRRGQIQQQFLDYLSQLNESHRESYPHEQDLAARIASYGLAARMQTAAREALDLTQETQQTKRMYGMEDPQTADYGSRCLIARRLIERGVRFVQVFTQNQFWDHHGRIFTALPAAMRKVDQPSAALIADLKQRGLLDSTVVHWGGEMGRLPVIQNDAGRDKIGRDHNTYGFTMLLAGGGFRGGYVHGATDEFGHHAVEDIVHHYDYHATLLHLFGLPAHVSYRYAGRDQTLLDGQEGVVAEKLLA
ncbi:MAG: DUF1501 domain-containing protein [Planctomycetales bacterium]|nr:DUF1501 domain-containing protein [Planctomycetales bacterium]